MTQEFDELNLTWTMTNVSGGDDSCEDNPLSRATKNLFSESGQPFKRLNKCFFQDPLDVIRWFGIFVHSAGDRIIFFPGYSKRQENLIGYRGDSLWKCEEMNVDHISLEKNRHSWHITNQNSSRHIGKIFTQKISQDAYYWFSLSVSSFKSLRLVKENTHIRVPIPSSDIDRRINVFKESRENAVFNVVSLNSQYDPPVAPSFIHFSVFFGPPAFDAPQNTLVGLPDDKFSYDVECCDKAHPVRLHRIELSNTVELIIIVSSHAGKLKKEFVFSGCSSKDDPAAA